MSKLSTSTAVIVLVSCLFVGSMCAVVHEVFECQPGVPYVQNGCNQCFCLKPNDLVCTAQKCSQNQDQEACSTGTVWEDGCNKCWCTNVGSVCTNNECNRLTY